MFFNWYQFLKLIQKHGNIEKFDFLFHKTGPQAGQPRGYGFVTYKTTQEAETAITALQNLKIGSKHIKVRYAHIINEVIQSKNTLLFIILLSLYYGTFNIALTSSLIIFSFHNIDTFI